MQQRKRIYSPCYPSILNKEPYGTQWIVDLDQGNGLYIQLSQNTEKPEWRNSRYLLEKIFKHYFDNEEFVEECLRLYTLNDTLHNAHNKLIESMKKRNVVS